MRLRSLLTILGLLLCATGMAQALRFDGGLVAGNNASQVQGDDYTGLNKLDSPAAPSSTSATPTTTGASDSKCTMPRKAADAGEIPSRHHHHRAADQLHRHPHPARRQSRRLPSRLRPYLGRMIKAEKWQRVFDTVSSLEDDLEHLDLGGQAYARTPIGESAFFQARISGVP